jgi:hypothetical protein
LSIKRIPRTLLGFVTLTACTILWLLFFSDLDHPFEGTRNVDSQPCNDLASVVLRETTQRLLRKRLTTSRQDVIVSASEPAGVNRP